MSCLQVMDSLAVIRVLCVVMMQFVSNPTMMFFVLFFCLPDSTPAITW